MSHFIELSIWKSHREGFRPTCINRSNVVKFSETTENNIGANSELLIFDGVEAKWCQSDCEYSMLKSKMVYS